MITQERLKELLHYDPDTGVFIRLKKANKMPAGSIIRPDKSGYCRVRLDGRIYYGHRLAIFYMEGVWPDRVDHRYGNRSNNKFADIRNVTHAENIQNQRKAHKDSSTGVLGVSYDKSRNRYQARIFTNGNLVLSKRFLTLEEASEAALKAKREHHVTCSI